MTAIQGARPSQVADILDICIPLRKPLSLIGPPGLGKSALVKQAAARLGYRLIDHRLAQMDPVDLRGVPSIQNGYTVFHPPASFPFADIVGDEPVLLFLDEFTQCPVAVQNAALELLLDRSLGGVPLGPNVSVITAGNRVEDKAGASRLTTAAASRFLTHVEMEAHMDDWLAWSAAAGIYPMVRAFVRHAPQHFCAFKPDENPRSFPCPRTWEHVSILAFSNPHIDIAPMLYRGAVGDAAAASFVLYRETCQEMPDPADVLKNPSKAKVPDKPAVLYGLMAGLVEVVRQRETDGTVGAFFAYIERVPQEFAVMACMDLLNAGVMVEKHKAGRQFCARHAQVIMRGVASYRRAA